MSSPWAQKRVMITGVCGTVGRELLRQISRTGPEEIIGIDKNESELFFLRDQYAEHDKHHFYLCDVRDRERLVARMRGIDIVMHAAAYKHVVLCEHSPWDAVQNNIIGTQNVIDAAMVNSVERVIFSSTDKAVNPTSVMGTSKLMCERLISAANAQRRGNGPILASSRFGNVLASQGSVMHVFARQIVAGGPVTLTDLRMTRFIMTLKQAVKLVMDAVFKAHGGEVFVTKMVIVRIEDLAEVMIEELAPAQGFEPDEIEVKVIGAKAGEKLYEELINEEETRRVIGLRDHFVILPALKSVYENVNYDYPDILTEKIEQPYNSSTGKSMSKDEVRGYLTDNKLLDWPRSGDISQTSYEQSTEENG